MILNSDFFNRDSLIVWKELLWKKFNFIDSSWYKFSGIINEVEIYKWTEDEASHAYTGKTPRNKVMFETFWHIYVYFVYGMYNCLNFTTEKTWTPGAILIRSIIPIDGIEKMLQNRKTKNLSNLTNWPAKLCQALWIDKSLYWKKLCTKNKIFTEDINYKIKTPILEWPRIGISKAQDKNWRFWFKN